MLEDSSKEIFESDVKKIVATLVEILVHVVQNTHIYYFCDEYFCSGRGAQSGSTPQPV